MALARMILKRAVLTPPAWFVPERKFLRPGYGGLISLLLTLALCVGCARPGSVNGDQSSPFVYAAVGDSTGIGLGARNGGGYVDRLFARIEQKRPGSTLINLCAGGATAEDAVNKQVARLGDRRVTLVTICVGVNDLVQGRDEQQFAEDYEALVANLRQSARAVVVANLPDIASAPAMKEAASDSLPLRLERFNKAIEEIASRKGVPLIDLYKLSREATRSRPELFSSDGLHPSDLGYAQWADAMWTVVERAINE